jgi:hypothetical protein
VPLILAASEPLDSIYRSVNSYPHLARQSVAGNPEAMSDGELAASARHALDELYAEQLEETRRLFEQCQAEGRGLTDVGDRRTWLAGGKVLAVRGADIPGKGAAAGILRYPI